MLVKLQQLVRAELKCLVVVAHPDDEIIWMGGLILRHPDWEWHIMSLCRSGDPDRAPRFYRTAGLLGVRAAMSDLDDSPVLAELSPDQQEITSRVLRFSRGPYDLIFTHGLNGEYGHKRHEQVNRAITAMADRGDLQGGLVRFSYTDCSGSCRPQPDQGSSLLVRLTPEEHSEKMDIIRRIYGFTEGSFEYTASGPVEAFNVRQGFKFDADF